MFKRLMYAMGRNDLAENKKLSDNSGRVAHEEMIDSAISEWASKIKQKDALMILEKAQVAAGPILNIKDMFEDPHYQARGLFERVFSKWREYRYPSHYAKTRKNSRVLLRPPVPI